MRERLGELSADCAWRLTVAAVCGAPGRAPTLPRPGPPATGGLACGESFRAPDTETRSSCVCSSVSRARFVIRADCTLFSTARFSIYLSINPSLPKRREDLATTAYNRRYNLHFAKRGRRRRNRGLVRKGQNERTGTVEARNRLEKASAPLKLPRHAARDAQHQASRGDPRVGVQV